MLAAMIIATFHVACKHSWMKPLSEQIDFNKNERLEENPSVGDIAVIARSSHHLERAETCAQSEDHAAALSIILEAIVDSG